MSKKANQHYVPQFYFRFFSEDGKSICVIKRETGEFFPAAPIKGQASRHKFYGEADIENTFSTLEGVFSGALRILKECADLNSVSEDNYLLILQAIMFQRARTLASRKCMQPVYNNLMRLFVQSEIEQNQQMSDEQKDEFISDLDNFELHRLKGHLVQIQTSIENAHHLGDLVPILVENKTNRPFIFSDSPVIFHNGYYENVKHRGVLGMSPPGLQVIFPISETRLLLLIDIKKYEIKRLRKGNIIHIRELGDVASFNRLQLHSASSAAYFGNFKYANYVHSLWLEEKRRLSDNLANIVEAPCLDSSEECNGEIIHSYTPQLPVQFKLSFLKHEILNDIYHFERR